MELKDLVPPLELCKQIPEGKFKDSALVWSGSYIKGNYFISQRGYGCGYIAPAPTLADIMQELYSEAEGCCQLVNSFFDRNGWEIIAVYEDHDDSGYGGYYSNAKDRDNPATAALKLWLSVMSCKSEKSEVPK